MQSRPRLSVGLGTGLRLTPGVQLALEFLQVPTLELEALVRRELAENPVLEIVEDPAEDPGDPPVSEAEGADDPLAGGGDVPPPDWTDYLPREDETIRGEAEIWEGTDEDRVRRAPTSLAEVLGAQLGSRTLEGSLRRLVEFLVGSLDERGYLTAPLEELAAPAEAPPADLARALAVLQDLEPPGIGARSLAECLALQLRTRGLGGTLAYRIVTEQFEHLAARRTTLLARRLRTSPARIEEACAQIRLCHPAPARLVASEEVRYIHPDLVVEQVGDDFEVWSNDRHVPRVRLAPACRRLLASEGAGDAEARAYVKERLRSARWIVQALDRRRDTMLRVMRCIVGEQRAFFAHGISHLKPMTLQTIANQVGLHESTVARVTIGKYAQTPRGLFALKFFFSSKLRTEQGDDVSARSVRARVRHLIAGEDRSRPLGDDEVARLLRKEGIVIARRTVAKYREQLGLERAGLRRRRWAS